MLSKKANNPLWHRILAIVLAVSMVLIPVNFPASAKAVVEYPNYFADSFESDAYMNGVTDGNGVTNKWDSLVRDPEDVVFNYKWNETKFDANSTRITAGIVDGAYQVSSTANNVPMWLDVTDTQGNDASKYWTDYTFEADLSHNETSGSVGPSVIGRVQYDAEHNGYTYYKAYMHKTRLYLKKYYYNTDTSKWVDQSLGGDKSAPVPFNTPAHISMSMVGNSITVKMSWLDASGNPQEVTVGPYIDEGQYGPAIGYGSVGMVPYGATSSGNTSISDLDNIKVTMENGQVLFTENFSDETYFAGKQETVTFLPEGVRWNYDVNFSWNESKFDASDRITAGIVDGAYQVSSTANNIPMWLEMTDKAGADVSKYWTDYTVEADLSHNETSGSVGPSLIGRVQYDAEHDGYAYYKVYMHKTRLYLKKYYYNTDTSKWVDQSLGGDKSAPVPFDTPAHISLSMVGNKITVTMSWKDAAGEPQSVSIEKIDDETYGPVIGYGTIGMVPYGATSNGNTSVSNLDNIKVTMADGQVHFAEDFSDERYFGDGKLETVVMKPASSSTSHLVTYKWNETKFDANSTRITAGIVDGAYQVSSTANNVPMWLDITDEQGNDASKYWTNYTFEADLSHNETSGSVGPSIIGRVQYDAEHDGYTYYKAYMHKSRLYLKKYYYNTDTSKWVDQSLGGDKSAPVPFNTPGHITMSMVGNSITVKMSWLDASGNPQEATVGPYIDEGQYGPAIGYGSIGMVPYGATSAGNTSISNLDNIKVTAGDGEVLFAEDFSGESYFTGKQETITIKAEKSQWSIKDGALTGIGSLYMTSTDGTNDLAASWADYAVDADVKLIGDSTGGTVASILANVDEDNYYELRLASDGLSLYKMVDGIEKKLAGTKGTANDRTFKVDQWHKLKLEIDNDGKTILCYANNEQLLVYVAGEGEAVPAAGKMGLKIKGEAYFDNVAAYAVELSEITMYGTFTFENQMLVDMNWNVGEGWAIADKMLVYTGSGETVSNLGDRCILENYNADYQVILPESGHTTVMGRYSAADNSAYKVTLDPADGLALSKMVNGTTKPLVTKDIKQLYMEGIKIEAGSAQNVKLYMYGNLLQVYLNGVRVLNYVDADAPLTKGAAAISGSNGTKLVSVVTTVALPLADLTILDGTYSKADPSAVIDEVHPIEVPLGKVPDVAKLWLKIGDDTIIPLDTLSIGALDGATVGSKTANVIYDGQIVALHYKVIDRSAEITALIGRIDDLKAPDQLTKDDASAVEAAYKAFVDLSALEKAKVEKASVEKLMAAREAILDLQYEEDLGDIIFTDTFDNDSSEDLYVNDYNITGQPDIGNWYVVNGEMLMYDTNKVNQPTSFTAANMLVDKNFQVSSVSVDVQFMEEKAWAGFMFNMNEREWYRLRITDKTNRLVLSKEGYAEESYTIYTVSEDPTFAGFKVGQWYNLRVTMSETGLIRCYVDGRLWFEHQDKATADVGNILTHGTVSLSASENWVKYDNFEVRGVELPYVAADSMHDNTDLPQQNYKDDFEDVTAGYNPSHWLERTDEERWAVKADGTNKVYASNNSLNDATQTWLYVSETNVDYTAKLRADALGAYPVMALTARVYAETSYFHAGYDFTAGRWFIKTRYAYDFPVQTIWGPEATVKPGEWHTLRLVVIDDVIALHVDGSEKPVVVADAGRKIGPGRVGVYTEQCNISIDDVDLIQLSGQSIAQDGAMEQYTKYAVDIDVAKPTGSNGTLFQVLPVKDGEGKDALLLHMDSLQYISYNGGMTWTTTTDYTSKGFAGGSVVVLHDGSILNIKNHQSVKISTDGGQTWNVQCENMTQFHAPGRNYSQPAEHLSEVQLADGTWRIFYTIGDNQKTTQNDGIIAQRSNISEVYYSDDLGVTWHMSKNSPLNTSNLTRWCESHVLGITKETKDFTGRTLPVGTLVHYSTYNSSDAMRYSLSFDGGVTWEGDYAMPEIPCGMNSMTIEYDYESGLYYMATWVNIPKAHNIGFPRERVSLLTSEDGYNWQLVVDVDRWGDVSSTDLGMLMQGVNMYLAVSDEYVFVSFSRSEAFSSSGSHNWTQGRVYRFEKDKLTNIRDMKDQYMIPAKTIIGIEAQPAIHAYKVDAELNLTGNKIKVYYYDGTTDVVDMADAFVHADLSAVGTANVTVDYEHFRAVYTVDVTKGDAPVISGVENDKTYCIGAEVTVSDANSDLKEVTVNGKPVTLKDGKFTLEAAEGVQTIVATDEGGNVTTVKVTVHAAHTPAADDGDCTTAIKCTVCGEETTAAKESHTGGTATCKDKAKCEICGKEYGELLTTHTGGTATCKDEAKCEICGKEYGELDADNHTGEAKWSHTDTKHTKKYDCCGAVAVAESDHKLTDGKCECGYEKAVGDNSQTGDNSAIVLFAGLIALSVLAMGVLMIPDIRKRITGR